MSPERKNGILSAQPGIFHISPRRFVYAIAFLIVFWVAAQAILKIKAPHPYTETGGVARGELLPEIDAKDAVSGTPVHLPSKRLNFLLYFNYAVPQNVQKVGYAAYLWRRFKPKDVAFCVITGGLFEDLEEMRRSGQLPFPIIKDSSFRIAHLLKVPRSKDGFFVFDNNRRVLFTTPTGAFEPEDIRELYEKFEIGKINYLDVILPSTAIGMRFPDVTVREIWSGRQCLLSEVTPPGTVDYVVFTAECPACALEPFLLRLRSAGAAKREVLPIFSSRLPEPVLRRVAKKLGVTRPLYVAQSELTGFENLYFARGSLEDSNLWVRTDRKGFTVQIQPGLFD